MNVNQAEFEKKDIYEELNKKEESIDFSKMKTADAEQMKQDLLDKRLVVSGSYDGEITWCGLSSFVCVSL